MRVQCDLEVSASAPLRCSRKVSKSYWERPLIRQPLQSSRRSARSGNSGRKTKRMRAKQKMNVNVPPMEAANRSPLMIRTNRQVPTIHPEVALNYLPSDMHQPAAKFRSNIPAESSRCIKRSRGTARSTLDTLTRRMGRVSRCKKLRLLPATLLGHRLTTFLTATDQYATRSMLWRPPTGCALTILFPYPRIAHVRYLLKASRSRS